jgi:hypothetical protein
MKIILNTNLTNKQTSQNPIHNLTRAFESLAIFEHVAAKAENRDLNFGEFVTMMFVIQNASNNLSRLSHEWVESQQNIAELAVQIFDDRGDRSFAGTDRITTSHITDLFKFYQNNKSSAILSSFKTYWTGVKEALQNFLEISNIVLPVVTFEGEIDDLARFQENFSNCNSRIKSQFPGNSNAAIESMSYMTMSEYAKQQSRDIEYLAFSRLAFQTQVEIYSKAVKSQGGSKLQDDEIYYAHLQFKAQKNQLAHGKFLFVNYAIETSALLRELLNKVTNNKKLQDFVSTKAIVKAAQHAPKTTKIEKCGDAVVVKNKSTKSKPVSIEEQEISATMNFINGNNNHSSKKHSAEVKKFKELEKAKQLSGDLAELFARVIAYTTYTDDVLADSTVNCFGQYSKQFVAKVRSFLQNNKDKIVLLSRKINFLQHKEVEELLSLSPQTDEAQILAGQLLIQIMKNDFFDANAPVVHVGTYYNSAVQGSEVMKSCILEINPTDVNCTIIGKKKIFDYDVDRVGDLICSLSLENPLLLEIILLLDTKDIEIIPSIKIDTVNHLQTSTIGDLIRNCMIYKQYDMIEKIFEKYHTHENFQYFINGESMGIKDTDGMSKFITLLEYLSCIDQLSIADSSNLVKVFLKYGASLQVISKEGEKIFNKSVINMRDSLSIKSTAFRALSNKEQKEFVRKYYMVIELLKNATSDIHLEDYVTKAIKDVLGISPSKQTMDLFHEILPNILLFSPVEERVIQMIERHDHEVSCVGVHFYHQEDYST